MGLTDKELKLAAERIAKSTFNLMKKLILKEMRKLPSDRVSDINLYMDLMIVSMINVDTNIIRMAKNIFKGVTKHELDMSNFISCYLEHILIMINDNERKKLLEKLNSCLIH